MAAEQARERALQARLAAEARARLAREQAAAAARVRVEARRRAAEAQAPQLPPTATTTTATTTTTSATTTAEPPPPAQTTTAAAPSPPPPAAAGHPEAARIALGYLGVPYRWGGATPAGFDCSGLVAYVFAQLGIQLPHYAAAQFGYGAPVAENALQPGDLVFFDQLAHVGVYIGGGQFVHAPQTGDVVKISTLATFGARYFGARRV